MTEHLSLFHALTVDPDGSRVGGLAEGYLPAVVTGTLARLDLPDHLPGAVEDLATAVEVDPAALRRLLAAAAGYGLVTQEAPGRFRLTGAGARLRRDAPGSLRDLVVSFCWRFAPLWQGMDRLVEAVRTGRPAAGNAPTETMDQFRCDPEGAASFARALSSITVQLLAQLDAAGYAPRAAERIVDVGGGTGRLLAGLLRRVPGAKGVLLDREQVLADAPAVLAEAGADDGVELVAGDFFAEGPAGDMHVLCQVLHDWDDDHVDRIVRNCARASTPGGRLTVIEHVLPSTTEPSLAHVMDLMMLMAGSGHERTREEHEALLAPAGYVLVRHLPLPGSMPWHVLDFERA